LRALIGEPVPEFLGRKFAVADLAMRCRIGVLPTPSNGVQGITFRARKKIWHAGKYAPSGGGGKD